MYQTCGDVRLCCAEASGLLIKELERLSLRRIESTDISASCVVLINEGDIGSSLPYAAAVTRGRLPFLTQDIEATSSRFEET